ncbi:MAG: phage baseplate assembly protein V [Pseudomonadota bacterium]|jgi:phage baseplate assembly protein V
MSLSLPRQPTEGAALRLGFVVALDLQRCRVRVRFPDLDGLESHWLPVLQAKTHRDQYHHLPDLGEHVACLLDARLEDGVVLGALYSARDAARVQGPDQTELRFADGTRIRYDRTRAHLEVDCVGDVTIRAAGRLRLQGARIDLN